jgi:hypothetical protein
MNSAFYGKVKDLSPVALTTEGSLVVVDTCLMRRFDGGGDTSPSLDRLLDGELIIGLTLPINLIARTKEGLNHW